MKESTNIDLEQNPKWDISVACMTHCNTNLNKSDMNWIKNIFSKKHDKHCAIHVVINSVCPNCGAKGHRTTLTNNSYACKKCKTWWVNGC